MMEYRTLEREELCLALFQGFRRHQVVNPVLEKGAWQMGCPGSSLH